MDHENISVAQAMLFRILQRYQMRLTPEGVHNELEVIVRAVYPDVDPFDRRTIRNALRCLGLAAVAEVLKGSVAVAKEADYSCPMLGTTVVIPCRNVGCRYHLKGHPEHQDCLLVRSRESEMSVDAISEVTGLDSEDVQDILLAAMRQMRQATVTVAKDTAELHQQFVFLHNPKVCGVCERRIDGKPFYVEDSVVICSPECCNIRPPSHIVIESRTGIAAQQVIDWAMRHFETIEAAAQALQFPPSVLLAAVGNHQPNRQ